MPRALPKEYRVLDAESSIWNFIQMDFCCFLKFNFLIQEDFSPILHGEKRPFVQMGEKEKGAAAAAPSKLIISRTACP